MAISTYLLTIILNVNRLNAPIKKIGWLNGFKNKTHLYAAYKRLTANRKMRTESEGMEKDIP